MPLSQSSRGARRAKPRRQARAAKPSRQIKPSPQPSPELSRQSLPSREELIAFIAGDSRPSAAKSATRVTKREIARAFDVKGEDKAALKRMIKDLETDGAVVRGRKVLAAVGRLPAMVVAEIVARDRDGELIARPVDWEGPGEAPRILATP